MLVNTNTCIKYNYFHYCSVKDIQKLEIISTEEAGTNVNDMQSQSKVIVKRPIAKRAGRSISECVPMLQTANCQTQMNLKKPIESNQQQAEQTPNGKIASGTLLYINYIFVSVHVYMHYINIIFKKFSS